MVLSPPGDHKTFQALQVSRNAHFSRRCTELGEHAEVFAESPLEGQYTDPRPLLGQALGLGAAHPCDNRQGATSHDAE